MCLNKFYGLRHTIKCVGSRFNLGHINSSTIAKSTIAAPTVALLQLKIQNTKFKIQKLTNVDSWLFYDGKQTTDH
ncbi:hypothetical protein H6G54_11755 [Anabaena cylindrica FACHB-243]|uniref:hypothetical protein n=1 Tax=Anabaena TaxID=1163 RepID=UPI0002F530BA|nr:MULTISPECIES: hypothetical protein [Anabaena]MBD2418361.1 hypothetical protein [Anabaena cylindrica FACHB-243]MBY5281175.1 hypothetical protein [Anabaena sp. CCAP 1446/1C]MBY5308712.1 hypothetical protein [Anabaena sp. CCAP 1446/1C]MCM2410277.1 hypothetical protein [Anabaena sp. CCAP 1446/1C]